MTQPIPRTADPRRADTGSALRRRFFLAAAMLQVVSLAVFVSDVLSELSEFSIHSVAELMGVVALSVGIFVTLREYRTLAQRNLSISRTLDAASGSFHGAWSSISNNGA